MPDRQPRGSVHVVLLLGAVAVAAVAAAAESAALALRRRAELDRLARQRVAGVVDAACAFYRDALTLPASLGALVRGGYLDVEQGFDPYKPSAALRFVRQGVRGTVQCSSSGYNHVDERGGGDDVLASAAATVVGAALTRELGQHLARVVASRVTAARGAGDLDPGNAARLAALASSRAWLEDHASASDWPQRLAAHVALAARSVGDAAMASGRRTSALAAAVGAVAGDADRLGLAVQGAAVERGALTAAALPQLGLERGAGRLLRAALLWLDDLQRAHAAGVLVSAAWRSRPIDRLAGFEAHVRAALLEAQDGASGLTHPLASYSAVGRALTGLGMPATARRDGLAQTWRLDPAPTYGFRSVGPDGVAGTADDAVFGAW